MSLNTVGDIDQLCIQRIYEIMRQNNIYWNNCPFVWEFCTILLHVLPMNIFGGCTPNFILIDSHLGNPLKYQFFCLYILTDGNVLWT